MDVRGASFSAGKAMSCPRVPLTMTVMSDCEAASMLAVCPEVM